MPKREIPPLYRSQRDKLIAGVCGGIAEHFKLEPIWVRLVFILLAFIDGVGIVIYILAWILLKKNPKQRGKKTKAEEVLHDAREGNHRAATFVGVILVAIGALFFLDNVIGIDFDLLWPLLIITLGIYLLRRKP